MDWRQLFLASTVLAGSQLVSIAPAQAAASFGLLPTSLAISMMAKQDCSAAIQPASGLVAQASGAVALSKSSAILGGQLSRLEMISQQQSGAPAIAPEAYGIAGKLPGEGLAPAAGGVAPCANLTAARANVAMPQVGLSRSPLGSEDFLASKRLPVRRTSFDGAWSRVKRASLPSGFAKPLAALSAGATAHARIAAVNSWANARIRYVDDQQLYGRADYWASAGTTLRAGAGDCEDIAIVKMQLLAGMGVARSEMYLTIARDLVRNADHAVLVVKSEGRFWLLDNATNELLEASNAFDYRPIMSFGASQKWLHGY